MATKAVERIAVLGPNSKIGPNVLEHLVKAGFNVTAFTRDPSKVTVAPEIKLATSDFASSAALAECLKQHDPFDAIVDLINRDKFEAHIMAVDAAIAAGIPHIIASAFGLDIRDKVMRELPMMQYKAKSDDHLQAKVQAGEITYTGIHNSVFMDWALENNIILNLRGGKSMIWEDGNIPGSWTMHDDIGRGVAGALLNKEKVMNKLCFVHSGILTQNKLIGWAREAYPEREIETVSVNLDEMIKQTWEKYNAGDRSIPTIRGFALVGVKEGYGNFGDKVDNEVLGVRLRSEEELKEHAIKLIA